MDSDLNKVLETFCRLDHVQGAMILDDSGLVVEEHFTGGQDSAHLAHVVLRSIHVGAQLAEDLGKASLNQQYIEFADLQVTAEMLTHNFVLVILAESGANLGRVRLEIRKNKDSVESMLA